MNAKTYFGFLEWEKDYNFAYLSQSMNKDRFFAFLMFLLAGFYLFDKPIVQAVRELPLESHYFFRFITNFGASHWYIVPSSLIVLVFWLMDWKKLSRRAYCQFLLIAMWASSFLFASAAGGLFVNLLKRMIGRARPRYLEDLGPYYFDPFAFKSAFASFPSGHSTTIGSMAFLFIVFFPKAKWSLMFFALMVGISRVVVGAHYPMDVIAGLALGGFISWLTVIFFVKRGMGFKRDECAVFKISPKWPKRRLSFFEFRQAMCCGFSFKLKEHCH